MVGPPLNSAHRLRVRSPNLTWGELKSDFSRQYSSIPFNSHATQAFAWLQQGPDELHKMYVHHASKLLLKSITLQTCHRIQWSVCTITQ